MKRALMLALGAACSTPEPVDETTGLAVSAASGTIAGTTASASAIAPGSSAPVVTASAMIEAGSQRPSASAPAAPVFLRDNPLCRVPPGYPHWSWKRLHRVEGLPEPAVVLTLDVGAKLPNLEKVLDVLRDERVQTTIFVYTKELSKSPRGPGILRRILDDGHELANHTESHKDLTKLEKDEVEEELDAVERWVKSIDASASTKPFFREPYLATNDDVDGIVRERCYRPIWFTIDTADWKDDATADKIVRSVFEKRGKPRAIEPGSIFIFHGSQEANLAALPKVIAGLRERGFSFMTLGEALRRAEPPPASIKGAAQRGR